MPKLNRNNRFSNDPSAEIPGLMDIVIRADALDEGRKNALMTRFPRMIEKGGILWFGSMDSNEMQDYEILLVHRLSLVCGRDYAHIAFGRMIENVTWVTVEPSSKGVRVRLASPTKQLNSGSLRRGHSRE